MHCRLTIFYAHSQLLKAATPNVLPANPEILEGVDDLVQLSYLNEPAVLHNLDFRYAQDKIYVSLFPDQPSAWS